MSYALKSYFVDREELSVIFRMNHRVNTRRNHFQQGGWEVNFGDLIKNSAGWGRVRTQFEWRVRSMDGLIKWEVNSASRRFQPDFGKPPHPHHKLS